MEFVGSPMFRQTQPGGPPLPSNATFAPGSVLPAGIDFATPPPVPGQFQFDVSERRSSAARRIGAAGQYNYSSQMSATRKVEKTATEINSEQFRAGQVSSASVDRFNEPMADLFQLLWDDMRRMKLNFPVIMPGRRTGTFNPDVYQIPIILIPAASAKTLDPQQQLAITQGLASWTLQQSQTVPVDAKAVVETVLTSYDPRITQGWLPDAQAEAPINARIAQNETDVRSLAQAGKAADDRLKNIEKLLTAVHGSLAKQGAAAVDAGGMPMAGAPGVPQ
jgi:hypothetical protein